VKNSDVVSDDGKQTDAPVRSQTYQENRSILGFRTQSGTTTLPGRVMYRSPVKSNTINMRELKQTPSFTVASHRTPFTWLTPTHLAFASTSAPDQSVTWQSRRARKGRYAPKATHVYHHETQKLALTARVWEKGTRMKPGFYLDISWWLAFTFTFGSAVWVVNGESRRWWVTRSVSCRQDSWSGFRFSDQHLTQPLSVIRRQRQRSSVPPYLKLGRTSE
jgi:hypothetical protein